MHQYPEKELKLIIWEQEDEANSTNKLLAKMDKREMEDWEMLCQVEKLKELRTHVRTHSKTMKVEGRLEGLLILLLIDSGASHNYITKELVTTLSLPITKTKQYMVTLGDGSRKSS